MRELKEKRIVRRFLFSKVTIVVLSLVLLLVVSATWGVYGKYQETAINKQKALEDFLVFKQREAELQEDIVRLQVDRTVEEEIRQNFGFVKEGEAVIVIIEEPVVEMEELVISKKGFFANLFNIFR